MIFCFFRILNAPLGGFLEPMKNEKPIEAETIENCHGFQHEGGGPVGSVFRNPSEALNNFK